MGNLITQAIGTDHSLARLWPLEVVTLERVSVAPSSEIFHARPGVMLKPPLETDPPPHYCFLLRYISHGRFLTHIFWGNL